jgi:hypothetical protein
MNADERGFSILIFRFFISSIAFKLPIAESFKVLARLFDPRSSA